MIITKKKQQESVLNSLKNAKKVFLVGCAQCATLCKTGGQEEIDAMEKMLLEKGKNITGKAIIDPACHVAKVKQFFLQNKDLLAGSDAILAMTCGNGVQSVKDNAKSLKVLAALDTLFLGKVERTGHFVQKCVLCGDCILDRTEICPITICSKGLLNGPCGGSKRGKCEIDRERDCGWLLIYNKLKESDEVHKMESYVEPMDHSKQLKPQKISV